jgi:4-hydroxyphenylpyruvate dioxygenase
MSSAAIWRNGPVYENIGNFREIRYFDIEGKLTGLVSKAMTSPCGKIRIPINESSDDKSQIEEFLREYHGEGIQHIALTTRDIYQTVETLKAAGTRFLDTPDTYYDKVDSRVAGHGENLARLRKNSILIDGAPVEARASCCRSSPKPSSGRFSLKSSSARVMRDLAKATSAPCSNPSKKTRSAVAY